MAAEVHKLAFRRDDESNTSVDLEGDISVPEPTHEDLEELSTLDEPVKDTFIRDLKAVGIKFFHVLYPKENHLLLRNWDLWGPLILCIYMAMTLQQSSVDSMDHGGIQFAQVFVIFWLGATVLTLNIKLLGGNISLFQGMCVLGYCILPLAVSLLVCVFVTMTKQTLLLIIVRVIVVVVGFIWSIFASTAFLADSQPPRRKALSVYPIFLFYFVISWLILSHNRSNH